MFFFKTLYVKKKTHMFYLHHDLRCGWLCVEVWYQADARRSTPCCVVTSQTSSCPKTADKTRRRRQIAFCNIPTTNIRVQAKIEYLAPLLMQMNTWQILNYWWFAFTEICFQFFINTKWSIIIISYTMKEPCVHQLSWGSCWHPGIFNKL